jgi:thiosulfate/3-mercaptopyruvate sulfurtransferase
MKYSASLTAGASVVFVVFVLAACASTSEARYTETFAHPEFIVSVDELAADLRDSNLVVIDTRGEKDYAQGHIPTAVLLPPSWLEHTTVLENGNEVENLVLPPEEITPVLQDAGISKDSRVVIYDAGRHVLAARVWWMLDYYGHDRIAVLDGGFAAWSALAKEISTETPAIEPGNFVAHPNPHKIADYEYVQSHIGDDATALCNALGQGSFEEEAIAGSVNLPQSTAYTEGESPVLKNARQMRNLLDQVGIADSAEVVFYCGAGYAAAQDYFVARALGLENVRLYDGSLRDWRARGGELSPGGRSTL